MQVFALGLNPRLGKRIKEGLLLPPFGGYDVGYGAYQHTIAHGLLDYVAKVDLRFIKVFCAVVKVGRVYEDSDPLGTMLDYCHRIIKKENLVIKTKKETT